MFLILLEKKKEEVFMFSDFIRISDSEYYEHSCCICICIYWLLIFFLLLIKSKSNSFLVMISRLDITWKVDMITFEFLRFIIKSTKNTERR